MRTLAESERRTPPPSVAPRTPDLRARYAALHREMVEQAERAAAVERHWLLYTLLGWEHALTCAMSYYLVEVAPLQAPYQWVYAALWLGQLAVALVTIRLVRGRPAIKESPLRQIINRVGGIFLLLCCNVAMLNATAGLPVFVFLPVLATLSSFAFLVLACIVSRRFVLCALGMFAAGALMARFPAYGFLIYGGAWLAVLQTIALVLWRRRKRWLATDGSRPGQEANRGARVGR